MDCRPQQSMDVSSALRMVAALFLEKEPLGSIGEGTGWVRTASLDIMDNRKVSFLQWFLSCQAYRQTLVYFPYFVKGEQLTKYEFLRRSKKVASFYV